MRIVLDDSTQAILTFLGKNTVRAKPPGKSRALTFNAKDIEYIRDIPAGRGETIALFAKKVRTSGKMSREEFETTRAALENARHPDAVNKRGVKDNWSDMKSRIRNILKRKDNKDGIYRLAKEMGIKVRPTDEIPFMLDRIRNKVAPAAGIELRVPRISHDAELLEDYVRGEDSVARLYETSGFADSELAEGSLSSSTGGPVSKSSVNRVANLQRREPSPGTFLGTEHTVPSTKMPRIIQ